jgi:cellulose biosynthesis protein BcsQ
MRMALVNQKGGVGKSTSAVYLAAGLARHGRTLLVDADPQQTVLTWSELAGDGFPRSSACRPGICPAGSASSPTVTSIW